MILRVLLWGFVGLLSLLVSGLVVALVAVNLSGPKAFVLGRVNALLANVVSGSIVVEAAGRITPFGIDGARVVIRDPRGVRVILADGVSARVDTGALVRSLLSRRGPYVRIHDARIAYADASLDVDDDGTLRLESAFRPRHAPSPLAGKASAPASGFRLSVGGATLDRGWVHGTVAPGALLDVDVEDAVADVALDGAAVVVTVERARSTLRALLGPIVARGRTAGGVTIDLATDRPPKIQGRFDGDVGGVDAAVRAELVGTELSATLHGRAAAGKTSPAVPLSLGSPLTVDADARGELRTLSLRARGMLGDGRVDVQGTLSTDPAVRFDGTVTAEHLSLAEVSADAPVTDLFAAGRGTITLQGSPRADFALAVAPTRIGGSDVPALTTVGTFQAGRFRARVLASSPSARGTADVAWTPARSDEVVVHALGRVKDVRGLSGGAVSGRLVASADGLVDLRTLGVDFRVVASAESLRVPSGFVGRVDADARVSGKATALRLNGAASLEGIEEAGFPYRSGALRVRGAAARPKVDVLLQGGGRAPDVAASAALSLGDRVDVRGLAASVTHRNETAFVGVEEARIGPRVLAVERAVVLGLGGVSTMTLERAPSGTRVRLDAPRIEIRRVARLLGLREERYFGIVAAQGDLRDGPGGPRGTARLALEDGSFDGEPGRGTARIVLSGQRVDAEARGEWDDSTVDLSAEDLRLPRSPFELESWKSIAGTAELRADVSLARLARLFPRHSLPASNIRGRATVRGTFERHAGGLPDLALEGHTAGFALAGATRPLPPSDGTAVDAPPPFRIAGVDLDVRARCSVARRRVDVEATLRDRRGTLARASLASTLGDAVTAGGVSDPDVLEAVPFSVHAVVPERAVEDFPAPFARPGHAGTFSADVRAEGTAREPVVDGFVRLAGYREAELGAGRSVTIDARLRYERSEGHLLADVTTGAGPAASLSGHVNADLPAVARGDARDYEAELHAVLDRLPLRTLPWLDERHVRGAATGSGDVAFGSRMAPSARVNLRIPDLAVGRLGGGALSFEAAADAKRLQTALRIVGEDGSVRATADATPPWPRALVPAEPATGRFAKIDLEAQRFRLALLRPVASAVVSGLDGRLDGGFHVDAADGRDTVMSGKLVVSGGSFEVPMLGEGLTGVRASVLFDPNGTIRVPDLAAFGASAGTVHGSASARLEGTSFLDARARVEIPRSDPMPVAFEGQALGELWGKISATARRDDRAVRAAVDLDGVTVSVPERSTRSLQPLAPAPRVVIGHYRGPNEFEALDLGGVPTNVASPDGLGFVLSVHARDVEVRRGAGLRVRVGGDADVASHPGKPVTVTGELSLRGGFLDVEGKRFEIERGTVTFVGEPDNPQVFVTAAWPAPDGSRVYADFAGPLRTGKVTLRSDPPHTRSEILSLILFGTTDGNVAPGGGQGNSATAAGTASAASLGGGVAAQGLDRALDDLTGLDVTARVDTSQAGSPRPELEIRIARDVSVAIAHALGVPAPGTNPDRNFATLDWRFRRHWSVETTFGDAGSSMLDLVWQYRY
ncbi:MAG TPA: translocation/assembly module TamB domain-containing protein [Polyangiaceae bacterium]|nr:translocation/assembly module TamB domain-containing protein [Polyangiaceae bacterium]